MIEIHSLLRYPDCFLGIEIAPSIMGRSIYLDPAGGGIEPLERTPLNCSAPSSQRTHGESTANTAIQCSVSRKESDSGIRFVIDQQRQFSTIAQGLTVQRL